MTLASHLKVRHRAVISLNARLPRCLLALFSVSFLYTTAISADSLPAYEPAEEVSSAIRIWGSPEDESLLRDWEGKFRQFHPNANLELSLHGPESTMAGVYTGVADIAFMAREMRLRVESMAFEWVYQRKPFSVEVANSAVHSIRESASLAVFVHADNPLQKLQLRQLAAIYGADRTAELTPIRKWGGLGLTEAWKDRHIQVYGAALSDAPALYFRTKVLGGSYKWHPALQEYGSPHLRQDADSRMLNDLAKNPSGIAYAPLLAANPGVKPIALSQGPNGPYVALTDDSVHDRSYPLSRVITMVINHESGQSLAPPLREFLNFILSHEGQDVLERTSDYIPLHTKTVLTQRARLVE